MNQEVGYGAILPNLAIFAIRNKRYGLLERGSPILGIFWLICYTILLKRWQHGRKPFTHYRDYFLQALLYAAEYELRTGQQLADEHFDDEGEAAEALRKLQRAHYSRAVQLYRTYATRSSDSHFDLKVTFCTPASPEFTRITESKATPPSRTAPLHQRQCAVRFALLMHVMTTLPFLCPVSTYR